MKPEYKVESDPRLMEQRPPLPVQPVRPEQEPVDFASLLREAEEIVQSKPIWKRFIDGTPLANYIAVWMAVFSQDVARRTSPPQRPWVGLTGQEKALIASVSLDVHDAVHRTEAKLKEKNND